VVGRPESLMPGWHCLLDDLPDFLATGAVAPKPGRSSRCAITTWPLWPQHPGAPNQPEDRRTGTHAHTADRVLLSVTEVAECWTSAHAEKSSLT
jgi:hypothetical protein